MVLYSNEIKSNFVPGQKQTVPGKSFLTKEQVIKMSEDLKALEIRATKLISQMNAQLDYINAVLDLTKSSRIDLDWQLSVDKRLITMQYDIIELSKKIDL